MSFKYNIDIEKNTESKFYVCFPSLTLFIFFMLNCQKMKIRGCSLAMWAAHDTFLFSFFFFKRSEAFIIIIISFAVLFVGAEMETVHSGFTLKLRHRGRSSEVRDQSFLSFFLSYCLFFYSLFSPSLSLV